jgi:hypothetical protein
MKCNAFDAVTLRFKLVHVECQSIPALVRFLEKPREQVKQLQHTFVSICMMGRLCEYGDS